ILTTVPSNSQPLLFYVTSDGKTYYQMPNGQWSPMPTQPSMQSSTQSDVLGDQFLHPPFTQVLPSTPLLPPPPPGPCPAVLKPDYKGKG
ncbi:hypothetical protein EW026_g8360, partial [Hermanssonia centrifuga]